jgi:hypothetical protein
MANRDFKGVQAIQREVKMVSGSFEFHATDGTSILSNAVGVTSTGDLTAGLVTLTLDDKYSRFLGVNFTYQDAVLDVTKVPVICLSSETVNTTKTVVLQFTNSNDGGLCANADVGGDTVYFCVWLKNSSVV